MTHFLQLLNVYGLREVQILDALRDDQYLKASEIASITELPISTVNNLVKTNPLDVDRMLVRTDRGNVYKCRITRRGKEILQQLDRTK